MKTFGLILAAAAALALSACFPPTTSHPVGTTIGLKNDPLLAGTWKADPAPDEKDGKFFYYHFLPGKDGTILAALAPSNGEPSDLILVRLTTVRVGAVGFMNARLLPGPDGDSSGEPPGTIPVLYRLDAKGRLLLFTPNEDAVKEAIKAGKIAGTTGETSSGDAVITADGPALDKFILSPAGRALFSNPIGVLTKLE